MSRLKVVPCLLDLAVGAMFRTPDRLAFTPLLPKHIMCKLLQKCFSQLEHVKALEALLRVWPYKELSFRGLGIRLVEEHIRVIAQGLEAGCVGSVEVLVLPDDCATWHLQPIFDLASKDELPNLLDKDRREKTSALAQVKRGWSKELRSSGHACVDVLIPLEVKHYNCEAISKVFFVQQKMNKKKDGILFLFPSSLCMHLDYRACSSFFDVLDTRYLKTLDLRRVASGFKFCLSSFIKIFQFLATLTSLRSLALPYIPADRKLMGCVIGSLGCLSELEHIAVSDAATDALVLERVFSEGIASIRLKSLELRGVSWTESLLKSISCNKFLRNLSSVDFSEGLLLPALIDGVCDFLRSCTSSLVVLNLARCMFTAEQLSKLCAVIKGMHCLEELYICEGNACNVQKHVRPLLDSLKSIKCLE